MIHLKEKYFFVLFSLSMAFLAMLYFNSSSSNDLFWELNKCPLCYGENSCNYLQTNLTLNKFSLANVINVKNVYYGYLSDRPIQVVAKKLAHTEELNNFDSMICTYLNSYNADPNLPCIINETWNAFINYHYNLKQKDPIKTIQSVVVALKLQVQKLGFETGILSCLPDHFLEILLNRTASSNQILLISNIATTLLINPEPLFMQVLEDLFPKLLGVCGRIIVQEYVGPTLSNYYQAPWKLRLKLAASLLELAELFTFNKHTGLAFYLTDVSFDNFAVVEKEETDTQIKLIDGESIVVVDPKLNSSPISVNNFEKLSSSSELRFSTEDLCTASYADHNFYAICKCILSEEPCSSGFAGGLLWGLPPEVEDKWKIRFLVKQCVIDEENRIANSYKLLQSIRQIVNQR